MQEAVEKGRRQQGRGRVGSTAARQVQHISLHFGEVGEACAGAPPVPPEPLTSLGYSAYSLPPAHCSLGIHADFRAILSQDTMDWWLPHVLTEKLTSNLILSKHVLPWVCAGLHCSPYYELKIELRNQWVLEISCHLAIIYLLCTVPICPKPACSWALGFCTVAEWPGCRHFLAIYFSFRF